MLWQADAAGKYGQPLSATEIQPEYNAAVPRFPDGRKNLQPKYTLLAIQKKYGFQGKNC